MSAVARHTDPITSHEAAAGVDLIRSQMLVLTFAHRYLPAYFTDKALVAGYRKIASAGGQPLLADSRLRTARKELVDAGLIFHAGRTTPDRGRSELIWTLDADLAQEVA